MRRFMIYDVAIAGYGPTGMLAAILLGRAGHRVVVLERYKTLYNLPRVGIVHDDVLRMFQEVGCLEKIAPATFFLPLYELANKGNVLLSNEVAANATHGHPEMTSIYQPAFEAELDVLAKAIPNVDVLQGETVVSIDQDSEGVTLISEGDAGRRTTRARYAIGADGGNSFVRRALGIDYEDLGFDQNWLVIDGRAKRKPRPDLPLLRQFCEPEQPGMTMQMGPEHRRWSFMIFQGESADEAVKPENVWRRLQRPEGATPDEFELIRVVAYKFQSLMARSWHKGRIFLAGDAAHQMPPFLAQGMCSGFRDAHNIAWKLDLVLKGLAGPSLLDSYETEREPNARATIVESMKVGQNVNERDPEKVRARDAQLMALQAARQSGQAPAQLIAFRVPGFADGFISKSRQGAALGAGQAFPQANVRRNGRAGPFDDIAGRGFLIVSRAGDPEIALSPLDRHFWGLLDGNLVTLDPRDVNDETGVYTRLMDDLGCDVLVKRPDNYIFGACPRLSDLPALIAEMRDQLG
jgi:2-polyprenyl-6-methoxyphenol hydroxylase-like FAD-dependent oxidoreductase